MFDIFDKVEIQFHTKTDFFWVLMPSHKFKISKNNNIGEFDVCTQSESNLFLFRF